MTLIQGVRRARIAGMSTTGPEQARPLVEPGPSDKGADKKRAFAPAPPTDPEAKKARPEPTAAAAAPAGAATADPQSPRSADEQEGDKTEAPVAAPAADFSAEACSPKSQGGEDANKTPGGEPVAKAVEDSAA